MHKVIFSFLTLVGLWYLKQPSPVMTTRGLIQLMQCPGVRIEQIKQTHARWDVRFHGSPKASCFKGQHYFCKTVRSMDECHIMDQHIIYYDSSTPSTG